MVLPAEHMHLLDETKLERRSLARNELLFRQGDKVHAIYFIEEGRLRLDRRTFDGRSLVFGTGSAGKFFVEAALFSEIFRIPANVTLPHVDLEVKGALGRTYFVRIGPEKVVKLMAESTADALAQAKRATPGGKP